VEREKAFRRKNRLIKCGGVGRPASIIYLDLQENCTKGARSWTLREGKRKRDLHVKRFVHYDKALLKERGRLLEVIKNSFPKPGKKDCVQEIAIKK